MTQLDYEIDQADATMESRLVPQFSTDMQTWNNENESKSTYLASAIIPLHDTQKKEIERRKQDILSSKTNLNRVSRKREFNKWWCEKRCKTFEWDHRSKSCIQNSESGNCFSHRFKNLQLNHKSRGKTDINNYQLSSTVILRILFTIQEE